MRRRTGRAPWRASDCTNPVGPIGTDEHSAKRTGPQSTPATRRSRSSSCYRSTAFNIWPMARSSHAIEFNGPVEKAAAIVLVYLEPADRPPSFSLDAQRTLAQPL